jgi:hypothetical protein
MRCRVLIVRCSEGRGAHGGTDKKKRPRKGSLSGRKCY